MIDKCWVRPGQIRQSAESVWTDPRTVWDRSNCRLQNSPHNGGMCLPDYGSTDTYCGTYNRPEDGIVYSNPVPNDMFYGDQCAMMSNNNQGVFVPQCANNVSVLNPTMDIRREGILHQNRMVAIQAPIVQHGFSRQNHLAPLGAQTPINRAVYGCPEQYMNVGNMRLSETGYRYKQSNNLQLPCNSGNNSKAWDYNSMCFDINNDGTHQPCSYASVVDLEDFMNNEKRKEKSRDAARCRRGRETQIFTDLGEALPMRREEVEQLDKATVMRLAIAYLRVRDVVKMLPQISMKIPNGNVHTADVKKQMRDVPDVCFLQALDGFVFAISIEGDIVFVSENIADYLGVTQTEMMGQSVFEFSHPCDHEELRELLRAPRRTPSAPHTNNTPHPAPQAFLLRLKCTLTTKGRNLNLKSASYKVIHCTGHVLSPTDDAKSAPSISDNNNVLIKGDNSEKVSGGTTRVASIQPSLVAVGRLIPHPSNIEVPLDCKTFLSKHSLDMKFTYADDSMLGALGYRAEELTGASVYQYHYSMDSAALAGHFKCLFSKGQCETGRYRFLAKSGGYVWVLTQATLIQDKQQRPVSVVCVNYVISGVECKDEVFSESQLQFAAEAAVKPETPTFLPEVTVEKIPVTVPKLSTSVPDLPALLAELPPPLPNVHTSVPFEEEVWPIPATANIFAPRTKEMNKGFLMFSEDDPSLTMLKEEPEDLTHLAPTSGDACIPLEDNPFDVFDDFTLEGYCGLLNDELGSPSTPHSLLLSEPDLQESDSSCEQSSLLTDLTLDGTSGVTSCESEQLSPSPLASYISMSGTNDPSGLVMWGALPEHVSLHRELRLAPPPLLPATSSPPPTPALQRLLAPQPDGAETGVEPAELLQEIYADQGNLPTWRRDESLPGDNVDRVGGKRGGGCDGGGGVDSGGGKRTRRSSPARPAPAPITAPASSVLMNLLVSGCDKNPPMPLGPPDKMESNTGPPPQHAYPPSKWKDIKKSLDNLTPILQHSKLLSNITSPINSNLLSPLSLNLGSPMSPNYLTSITPRVSPAISERYTHCYPSPPTNSNSPLGGYNHIYYKMKTDGNLLSPITILHTGHDPMMTNSVREQISPIVDGSLYRIENNQRIDDTVQNTPDINSMSVQKLGLEHLGLNNPSINNSNVNELTDPGGKLFGQMIDTGLDDIPNWMNSIC